MTVGGLLNELRRQLPPPGDRARAAADELVSALERYSPGTPLAQAPGRVGFGLKVVGMHAGALVLE